MNQHLRELKDMRRVAREENITDAALAEYLKCDVRFIFDITSGKTKEGELRDKVLELLTSNEVAAAWHNPLIKPRDMEKQPPVVRPAADVPADRPALPAGHTDGDAMRAAWLALGISQGELAARFNRNGTTINPILMGRVTRGPLYNAVRAHLLEGKPAVLLDRYHPASKGETDAPAPVAAPSKKSPAPAILQMPVAAVELSSDYDTLMARAMAAEELAESLKDLAMLRQAESRYATALTIARRVGLISDEPKKKVAA